MTAGDHDYDEILRRALRAAVDPIEPAGDGLTRIRSHLHRSWLSRQLWLIRIEFEDLASLILIRCQPTARRARAWLTTTARTGGHRARPRPLTEEWAARLARMRTRSAMIAMLKPASVVAAAVVVMGFGAYALTHIEQSITPASQTVTETPGSAGGSPGHGGTGALPGGGQPTAPYGGLPGGHRGHTTKPTSAASCSPTPNGGPSVTPLPSPSDTTPTPTGSPSPTTTGGPTPSGSPTPSPSGTGTTGPLATPSSVTPGGPGSTGSSGIQTRALTGPVPGCGSSPTPSAHPSPSVQVTAPSVPVSGAPAGNRGAYPAHGGRAHDGRWARNLRPSARTG